MHPEWNTLTEAFDADIAVVVLENDAVFNKYIHPICVTTPNTNIAAITTGIVVGYGRSEDQTKFHENIPKALISPITNNRECFSVNRDLAKISSGRTFCGGPGKGVGVCNGDSGSGLFVTNGSLYYLRGVVSSSLKGGPYECNVDTYSVFTDATKYINFIKSIPTNRF